MLNRQTGLLNTMLSAKDEDAKKALFDELKTLHAQQLENYRNTVQKLSKVFITPIDRESVHQISIDIHNAGRSIYTIARTLSWLDKHPADSHILLMGNLLLKSAEEMRSMVDDIGNAHRMLVMKHAQQLHRLRREMDAAYEHALQHLFERETAPDAFLRRFESYNAIRDAGEYCQQVAHAAENVVLTHVG